MVSYNNLLSSEEECQTWRHSTSVSFYISICRDCTRWSGVFTPFSYIHLIDVNIKILFKLFIITISCRGKQIETTYLFPTRINYISNDFKSLLITAWSLTNRLYSNYCCRWVTDVKLNFCLNHLNCYITSVHPHNFIKHF